jgi:hypothetical protein
MPAGPSNQTMYIGSQGAVSAINVASLYKLGELGSRLYGVNGTVFQLVQCDSGPASVAIGNVAFWKSKSSYIVTTKQVDAAELRNAVAGVFTVAVTPGNYTAIQISGRSKATCSLNNMGAGDLLVANTGTAADVTNVALGTAPTCLVLGISPTAQAAVAGVVLIDLTIGDAATTT